MPWQGKKRRADIMHGPEIWCHGKEKRREDFMHGPAMWLGREAGVIYKCRAEG